MKKCIKCGREILDRAKICPYCSKEQISSSNENREEVTENKEPINTEEMPEKTVILRKSSLQKEKLNKEEPEQKLQQEEKFQDENITENKEDNDIRDLSIIMPANSLSIGQSGDFSISKDAGPYSCCVPLSALYQENGKVYVYVTDTENTVLGTVMVARKVEVTVQDRNQTTAALGEGSLSTDQAVIVQADRELKDGSRVRISEN